MYDLDGHTLPLVTVANTDGWEAYIKNTKMAPEQIAEFMILLKREGEKIKELAALDKLLRVKAMEYYNSVALDKRESITTEAVILAYSPEGETIALRDRDETVESLTDEQIRISYTPSMSALKVILKADELERLTVRKPRKHSITLRDNKGPYGEF